MKTELKKCLYAPFLLLTVCGTLILCLAAVGEYDYSGKSVTIFQMLLAGAEAGSADQSNLMLWIAGCSGWLRLLLPLLTAFGYIVTLASERQSGETANVLIRMGKFRYAFAKIIGGALSGGIGFAAGYALFGVIAAAAFPAFSGVGAEEQALYLELYGVSTAAELVAERLFGSFLYGVFAGVFGMGVAIAVRDKYMLLCLPFLLNYFYTQVMQKLLIDSTARDNGSIDLVTMLTMDTLMSPATKGWPVTVGILALIYAALIFAFYLVVKNGRG